jgi:SAM-dependent methyltransferase
MPELNRARMDELARDNLAYWNEAAPIHVDSSFYRTGDFRRGEIVLDPIVREGIGDVSGKRLLHLQCHFGLDTLSLARMGAEVVGLDYSDTAISAARALALETGVAGEFILADVLQPPAGLDGFDIVFASWGAICWHRDIGRWMAVAAGALRRGGRLYLVDGHPAMLMMDDGKSVGRGSPFAQRFPYDSPEPVISEGFEDYAEPDRKAGTGRTGSWIHGLGRIVNAAIDAGFQIRRLEEGDRVPWPALPQLVNDGPYWTLPAGAPFLPLNFALDAVAAS